MDAQGEYCYDAFIVDGLQDGNNIDFAIFEDITEHDVLIKRRGKVGGILKKKTPFIIMSNRSPVQIFGDLANVIISRCMVLNISGTPLFPLINNIRQIHNLPEIVNNDMDIPEDYN